MRAVLNYCENCGIQYSWLASGFNHTNYKYGTSTHCYDCNKIVKHYNQLMSNELNQIEKLSIITYVETDEVSLQKLMEWEELTSQENKEFIKNNMFPISTPVFCGLARMKNNEWETERVRKVNGREQFDNRTYMYNYWPSEPDKAVIKVYVRQDTKTKQIIQYIN